MSTQGSTTGLLYTGIHTNRRSVRGDRCDDISEEGLSMLQRLARTQVSGFRTVQEGSEVVIERRTDPDFVSVPVPTLRFL